MTYKELLNITKNSADLYWTSEQRDDAFENRYKSWVRQQNDEYDQKNSRPN